MKLETYEKARMLEDRMIHIARLREILSRHEYSDPPTRDSGYEIRRHSEKEIRLNNGEMEAIKNALEAEHTRLLREFAEL